MYKDKIVSGLGEFSKAKFDALLNVRSSALAGLRTYAITNNFSEVTTSSLVNIAGSCENPYASFTLNYYGRDAHLSQSAQLQLEALVVRLKRSVITVNNSFREEDYDDPEAEGRRLSEFTLIEYEKPLIGMEPEDALDEIINMKAEVIKTATKYVLDNCEEDIVLLGGKVEALKRAVDKPFERLTYDEALEYLNSKGCSYEFGHDLGVRDERMILEKYDNQPVFVTHFPTSIKFFNMKRMDDGQRVYSVDLLTPRLGETTGGAVREEDGKKIKEYLLESKIAEYVHENNGDVLEQFGEYMKIFDEEEPTLRGGFGVGFERFVGFLLHSNDILNTIAHRSMQPTAA